MFKSEIKTTALDKGSNIKSIHFESKLKSNSLKEIISNSNIDKIA